MILSDRVSGKMPAWGLLFAAAALAIVSLPGLSLAQKSAGPTVGTSEQIATSPGKPRLDRSAARADRIGI